MPTTVIVFFYVQARIRMFAAKAASRGRNLLYSIIACFFCQDILLLDSTIYIK